MSDSQNAKLLEWLVEEYLDLGYILEDAIKMAQAKFETLPVPDLDN
jgi:hypothetical protein|tara:strand:- start:375 stop:512 length:138 start_codon:yes stop_codon:yes gene_type:complete